MENKELATGSALAMLDEELSEETSGFNPQTVVVKIQHQEAMFNIPSLPAVKRLEGVILASARVRVFYPRMGNDPDTETLLAFTNNRPFCTSMNYTTGALVDADWESIEGNNENPANFIRQKIAEGGGECRGCPMNQWESVGLLGRDGKGKACDDKRRLLFWKEGIKVPILLPVPVSSIRNWDAYCSSLESAGMRHNQVITEIDLEIKETPGRKWSVLSFDAADGITESMAEELMVKYAGADGVIKPLVTVLLDIFKGREIDTEEATADSGVTSEDDDDL